MRKSWWPVCILAPSLAFLAGCVETTLSVTFTDLKVNNISVTLVSLNNQAIDLDYKVVLAPSVDSITGRIGTSGGFISTSSSTPINTNPAFNVSSGWGFFTGRRPQGRTRRIAAGAQGVMQTDMIVQVVDTVRDRVFFLGPTGSSVKVNPLNDPANTVILDVKDHYVEAVENPDGSVTISAAMEIPTTGPIADFVTRVKTSVDAVLPAR